MIDWVKPNGCSIKTNSEKATIAKAKSLGWKREGEKRGRPKKESDNGNG